MQLDTCCSAYRSLLNALIGQGSVGDSPEIAQSVARDKGEISICA